MEWSDQGTLKSNMKTLTEKDKLKVALDICKGLAYLHSKRIAHRDLKSEHILLFSDELTAKISSLGTSKFIPLIRDSSMVGETGVVGARKYSAPELQQNSMQVCNLLKIKMSLPNLGNSRDSDAYCLK